MTVGLYVKPFSLTLKENNVNNYYFAFEVKKTISGRALNSAYWLQESRALVDKLVNTHTCCCCFDPSFG